MGHYIESDGSIVPTVFDISFQFTPLHEEVLGFKEEGSGREFASQGFPYSLDDVNSLFGDEE